MSKWITGVAATVIYGVLAWSTPLRLEAQSGMPQPTVVWSNIENYFYVQRVHWDDRWRELYVTLKAKRRFRGKMQAYAYDKTGEFDEVEVKVAPSPANRPSVGGGPGPGTALSGPGQVEDPWVGWGVSDRLWQEGEERAVEISLSPDTSKVEFTFAQR